MGQKVKWQIVGSPRPVWWRRRTGREQTSRLGELEERESRAIANASG